MNVSRRGFLQATGAGALTLYVANALGLPKAVAEGIPGGTLPATQIPQFRNRLVVAQIAPCWRRTWTSYGPTDCYDMSIKQIRQQMLPVGMPQTTVWAYGPTGEDAEAFHAPGLTIMATSGTAVQVKWTNELVDDEGRYLPHLFAVDRSLHWANVPQDPMGEVVSTDTRPSLTGRHYVTPDKYTDPVTQYTDYTGPVPIATHLHGAMGVKDHSDGYSEAWYLPKAVNIPAGHAKHGRWYEFLAAKAKRETGVDWGEGFQIATYPNGNRVSTLWFHDHALGITRLSVYSGATSFYLVRGTDADVTDARTGAPAVAPWLNTNDGGMLDAAVNISALPGWRANRVVLAPEERVELLVDFTRVGTGRHILRNVGPDAFFPGGRPAENGEEPRVVLYPFAEREVVFPPSDPATTGRVMAFDVVPATSYDNSTPGRYLRLRPQPKLPAPVRTRRLATTMSFHKVGADPAPYASHTMLVVLEGTPGGVMRIKGTMWGDPVTENPDVGDVEDWEIYNLVQDAPVPHPIHIHETTFEILERRMVDYDWDTGVMTMGPQLPLLPGESGRKDTAFAYPGEMMRVRMRFTVAGQYMWHCHLLEHEDNEMMRPFRVGPWQDGQPEDMPMHHG